MMGQARGSDKSQWLPVLLFAVVVLLCGPQEARAQGNATYAVVAPNSMRPGSDYVISVTLFSAKSPVTFSARLQDSTSNVTLVTGVVTLSVTNQQANTTSLSIPIPAKVPGSYYLLIVEGSGGLTFSQNHSVSVSSKVLSIFIQTDKSLYKPGQTILFRCIVVNSNLLPYKKEINLTVSDQNGNKINQWLNLKNESGVVGKEVKLSDQTPLGPWTIECAAGGNVEQKKVTVAEYVLPKFKVDVILPPYYFVNINQKSLQKDLTITVEAKYTYGEPVKGRANISVQIQQYYPTQGNPVKTYDAEVKNGTAQITVPIVQLLALVPLSYTPTEYWSILQYRTILVSASVQETVTGVILGGNSTVNCYNNRYNLNFLDITASSYRPGMLFYGYLQLVQPDGSLPLPEDVKNLQTGEYGKITVTASSYSYTGPPDYKTNTDVTQLNVSLTESGYMMFVMQFPSNATSINLRASYNDSLANTTVDSSRYLSLFNTRDKDEAIQLRVAGSAASIETNVELTFLCKTTKPITTYIYQVLGKGSIVISQTIVEKSPVMDHTFSLTISTATAQKLAPTATVIVLYVTSTGEMISDSLKLSVAGASANQVALTFDKTKVAPADTVSLTVNAYQGSYVGILAVDMSVQLLATGNDITNQMVSDDQDEYATSSSYYGGGILPPGAIAKRRKRSSFIGRWPIFMGGTDTISQLQNAGVFVLTDAYLFTQPPIYYMRGNGGIAGVAGAAGAPGAAAPGAAAPNDKSLSSGGSAVQEPARTRTEFPETWMWGDMIAGPNNSTVFNAKVPDTITSWVASAFAVSDVLGLGVCDKTASVTVFQSFFISITAPYSIIRGEEIAYQVSVFNYLKESLNVRVTLSKSPNFKVRLPNSVSPQSIDVDSDIIVPSNDAVSVYYWIVAETLGQIPIKVTARSAVAADAIEKLLLVKPEGVTQYYSTALLIQLPGNGSVYSNSLGVSLPPKGALVPDSQHIECTVVGDVMGTSIQGLDQLLQMPYGCGEQNMLNFAPDVSIVKYLKASGQQNDEIMKKAIEFMLAGYQRELTYQRKDGSLSAFGDNDLSGSTWLSAFVARVFCQAKEHIPVVEDSKIARILNWIMDQQNSNGSFNEPGRVIHTDMQGGSSQGITLTAYVLNSLCINKNNTEVDKMKYDAAIRKGMTYLESKFASMSSDPYSLSIISNAMATCGSSRTNEAFEALKKLAIVEEGKTHWEQPKEKTGQEQDQVMDANGMAVMWRPMYVQSRSVNIELTSYALLMHARVKDITGSLAICKWLIGQRNSFGGFSSTQDTVMGMEALAACASLVAGPTDGSGLKVTVSSGSVQSQFQPINRVTALLLQSIELPSTTTNIQVSAEGAGTALVQLNVKYNVPKVQNINGMLLDMKTETKGKEVIVKSCGSWNGSEESGMVVYEQNQLTGYMATNLDTLKEQTNGSVMRIESDGDKIVLYFNGLTKTPTCVVIKSQQQMMVNNIQEAEAKIYRYYDKSAVSSQSYKPLVDGPAPTYCETCPQCCVCDSMNYFKCGDGSCRSKNVTCNGVNECSDGSDEKVCGITCTSDTFKCNDGRCVAGSSKCNKVIECMDGSDEAQCPDLCRVADVFQCKNGQCVAPRFKIMCNGRNDCYDASDELDQSCGNKLPSIDKTGKNAGSGVPICTTLMSLLCIVLAFM